MADRTGIEWTDATWNPIVGCSVVSPGCTNCYAMKMAARIEAMQPGTHYAGTTQASKAGAVWTGKLAMAPDSILTQPLRWRRPRKIFVNSMGDLFHEDVPDEWIDRVFAIMALTPQHTFQVLTKRSARMRAYCNNPATPRRIYELVCDITLAERIRVVLMLPGMDESLAPDGPRVYLGVWPLPNVWKGVSTEDQRRADERVPDILATPAAIRFVSAEPLLGPLNLRNIRKYNPAGAPWIDALRGLVTRGDYLARAPSESSFNTSTRFPGELPALDLVIVGGESGRNARPMHPEWARSLRDQCAAAGTAFFFKQWGEWAPSTEKAAEGNPRSGWRMLRGHPHIPRPEELYPEAGAAFIEHMGKKRAGRLLDGVEHNAMPEGRQ